jgi:hypothetical protein
MNNPTREAIAVSLFNVLQTTAGFNTFSRRPQLWDEAVNMPALYMGNPQENYAYPHGIATPPLTTLEFDIIVYINVGLDPNTVPDTILNTLLDALETTITPYQGYVQTLGGVVNHAWIEGKVERRPGYLDGQGAAFFTIRVLVP